MMQIKKEIEEANKILKEIAEALDTEDWEHVVPHDDYLKKEIGTPQQLYDNIKLHESFNVKNALGKFTQRTQSPRKIKTIYKYVTAACILLSSLIYFTFHYWGEEKPQLTSHSLQHAYLVLDNGQHINLNQKVNLDKGGVKITNSESSKIIYTANPNAETAPPNKLIVPLGAEKYILQLSDGTIVKMNVGSELTFPSVFTGDHRIVELSGEAYFDVTHSTIPFIVRSKNMDVKVLGTTFNMMVYPEEPVINTTLISGKVIVTCHSDKDSITQTAVLTPGMQANYQKEVQRLEINPVDCEYHTAWTKGELSFENASIEEIMRIISRNYNLKIVFDSEELKAIKCFISIRKEKGFEEILKVINMATGVQFRTENDVIHIYK
ncbi:FecR family protein [Butyricimonas virosa]|uniref:FecR family protein n=2 Tax=Butyricimonas virosa TaxID=544645 RepID=UPI003A891E26